jgi:mycothiol synthase
MVIRPFANNQADYLALTAVYNAVYPEEPASLAEWQYRDAVWNPRYYYERFLAVVAGRVVGVGRAMEPAWSYRPGKYDLDVAVHPNFRRRGIGSALYDQIIATLGEREPAPNLLTTQTLESQGDGLHFLRQRGFQPLLRVIRSRLELEHFDPSPYQERAARLAARNIRLLTISELAPHDPDWQHKLWELMWQINQDVPYADAPTRTPFEEFQKRTLQNPLFSGERFFIALDGEQFVGLTDLWPVPSMPERLDIWLTGVIRSHRRLGIATALKLRAIAYARQVGAKRIEASNEENNPMYQINRRLGFEPLPAWVEYEKQVAGPGE